MPLSDNELQTRITEARALQTRVNAPITRHNAGTGHLSARTKREFKRIDRNTAKPKLQYFRAEYKYAMPQNIANARNPMIFGKIPLEYQVIESWENEQALHASMCNPNSASYRARVASLNFRKPNTLPSEVKRHWDGTKWVTC